MTAVDAVHVSPRTAEHAMAFTWGEVGNGALFAWTWFLLLFIPATMGVAIMLSQWDGLRAVAAAPFLLVIGGLIAVPVSLVVTAVGLPIAYGLAMLLRRVRADALHLAVFAVFGATIGGAAVAGVATVFGFLSVGFVSAYTIASAVAVAVGWWKASRRALASDADAGAAGERVG